jgi:hypothetical protein
MPTLIAHRGQAASQQQGDIASDMVRWQKVAGVGQ